MRCPPPGITSTAAPVAFSLAGKKGVIDGLWIDDTCRSPFADVFTISGAVLPSEPGAPLGQSRISCGASAPYRNAGANARRKINLSTDLIARLMTESPIEMLLHIHPLLS